MSKARRAMSAAAKILSERARDQEFRARAFKLAAVALEQASQAPSTYVQACYVKLALEALYQALYLSRTSDPEAVLRRRTRSAHSFTARMITDAPDTPGPIKRKVLRAYLALCELVHPTPRLYGDPTILTKDHRDYEDKLLRALDAALYAAVRLEPSIAGSVAELAEEHGLELSLKAAVKRL